MSSSLSVLIVTPGVCSLAVGAARPGELLPSCAVSLESGQQGPGFGKGEAEEGEIILQIPQAAGQAGMVSGQVLLWGWAACVSPGGGQRPRLAPAPPRRVSLRRALLAAVRGCPLGPFSGAPGSERASVRRGGRAGWSRLPAPSRPPAAASGPAPA